MNITSIVARGFWIWGGTTATLVFVSDQDFLRADNGELVKAGEFARFTCVVSGRDVTIPLCANIPTTTDSPSNPNATWSTYFLDYRGGKRSAWLSGFRLSHAQTSPTTWASIYGFSFPGAPSQLSPGISFDMAELLISQALGTLNLAGLGVAGRIETATVPTDAAHPKAVETGDIRITPDQAPNVASIRTLGTGPNQAMPGDASVGSGIGVTDVTRAPYNADNTGATDASEAIQQAINDGNRRIYLPAGTYLIGQAQITSAPLSSVTWAPIDFHNGHPQLELFGDGVGKTIITVPSNVTYNGNNLIDVNNGDGQSVHDLTLLGAPGYTSGSVSVIGVDSLPIEPFKAGLNAHIYNVEITGWSGDFDAGAICLFTQSPYNSRDVDTTFNANIAAGVRTITPPSMSGIWPGRALFATGAVSESFVVTSVTTTTFTATFAQSHVAGDLILGAFDGWTGLVAENINIHDNLKATAILAASAGNSFSHIKIKNVGAMSTQHAFYVQAGRNLFSDIDVDHVGGYVIHQFPTHASTLNSSGNVYQNIRAYDPGGAFVLISSEFEDVSSGVNTNYPAGTGLSRYTTITHCLFKNTHDPGSAIIGNIVLAGPTIFDNNTLEDVTLFQSTSPYSQIGVHNINRQIWGTTPSSATINTVTGGGVRMFDGAIENRFVMGQSAFPRTAGSGIGGNLELGPGMGVRKFTAISNTAGPVVLTITFNPPSSFYPNGFTLTSGVDFALGSNNTGPQLAVTANNLVEAINTATNAGQFVRAEANGANVYIMLAPGMAVDCLLTTNQAGRISATNGPNGKVRVWGDLEAPTLPLRSNGGDNWQVIQDALNASSNATVLLAAGDFNISRPLVIRENNKALIGVGGRFSTKLIPTFACGPAIAIVADYLEGGMRIKPSLVPGAGNAYELGISNDFSFNLRDSRSLELDGLAAFTVEFFYKPIVGTVEAGFAGSKILCSQGKLFVSDPISSAFSINTAQIDKLQISLNINGVVHTISTGDNALLVGTIYHIELSYDGTTIRLFLNGVLVGSVAAAGTITQEVFEDVTLGTATNLYPDTTQGGANGFGSAAGWIDGLRISSIARHTAPFVAPTVKPVFDNDTLMLMPFADNKPKVTQVITSFGVGYLVQRYHGFEIAQQETIRNIEIDGGALASGIFAWGTPNSIFENLYILNCRIGLHAWNNSFTCKFNNIKIEGSTPPNYRFSASNVFICGVNKWDYLTITNGAHGFIGGDSSMFISDMWINITGKGQAGAVFRGTGLGTAITLRDFFFSDEGNAEDTLLAGLILSEVDSVLMDGGNLEVGSGGNADKPCMIIDGGGIMQFNNLNVRPGLSINHAIELRNPTTVAPVFIAPIIRTNNDTPLTDNDDSVTQIAARNAQFSSPASVKGGVNVDGRRVIVGTMPAIAQATDSVDIIPLFNQLLYNLAEHGVNYAPRLSDIPGLYAQFAAGHIVGVSDGDPVETWRDITGNRHDALQATVGLRPLLRAAGLNGVVALEFDGVDDHLSVKKIIGPTPGNNATIIATIKTTTTSLIGLMGSDSDLSAGAQEFFVEPALGARWYPAPAISLATLGLADNTPYVVAFTFSLIAGVREMVFWRNGTKIATVTAADVNGLSWGVPTIGDDRPGDPFDHFFSGLMRDMAWFNRKLTDAEVLLASQILGSTCGIAVP